MRKKLIMILLLGAGAIVLIMISILLTNQYLPAVSQTSGPPTAPISSPAPTVHSNAHENQVMRYLNYWNEKNAQQMDSLWIPEARGENAEIYEIVWIERVEPLSARGQPASSIPEDLVSAYSSMHAVAYVLADFTVYYNEAGQAEGMREESKRSDFPFFLVQPNAGDEWLIAALGY